MNRPPMKTQGTSEAPVSWKFPLEDIEHLKYLVTIEILGNIVNSNEIKDIFDIENTYWYWKLTLEIFEKCHLFHVSLDLFPAFVRLLGFWQVNVHDIGLHRVNVVLRKSLVVFIESMYRCSCFYLYLFFGCNGNFPERDYINITSHKKINKKFHQNGVKKTKRFVIWSYLTIWPSLPPCS